MSANHTLVIVKTELAHLIKSKRVHLIKQGKTRSIKSEKVRLQEMSIKRILRPEKTHPPAVSKKHLNEMLRLELQEKVGGNQTIIQKVVF